jgi:hypothetical protein
VVLPIDLIASAQRMADMVPPAGADIANEFVDAPTWLDWMNQGQEELWTVISSANKDTFFRTFDFSLTAPSNSQALPVDFRRIRGLDLNPTQSIRRSVQKFNFGDRNKIGRQPPITMTPTAHDRAYRVVTRALMLIESPESCTGDYRLYYVNGPSPMTIGTNRSFAIATSDVPVITGGGSYRLSFANGNFLSSDVGSVITVAFDSPNGAWSGTYIIASVLSSTFISIVETFPDPTGFSNPAGGTVNVIAVDAPLMPELEPYAEYVALVMARKALLKEESEVTEVDARIAQMRQDIETAADTDEANADSVVDVEEHVNSLGVWG